MRWSSGGRAIVTSVCAGDLITVGLALAAGEDPTAEDVNHDNQPPHLVYVPEFTGSDAVVGTVGGVSAPPLHPLEYRVDLVAFWCPYNGQIALDGGGGRPPIVPVAYDVWWERVRCAARPPDDPTFVLRKVGAPVRVPRGAYAVSVPVSTAITFYAGVPQTFTIDPGQRFLLGSLAFGQIGPSGATIQAIAFHLRL
jgi:hypothetical protein